MKKLFTIALCFFGFLASAQTTEIPLLLDPATGIITAGKLEKQPSKYDTVPVVMLVSDTSNSESMGLRWSWLNDDEKVHGFFNEAVWQIRGYAVELHRDPNQFTFNGPIAEWLHVIYLDSDKRVLRLYVWQSVKLNQ